MSDVADEADADAMDVDASVSRPGPRDTHSASAETLRAVDAATLGCAMTARGSGADGVPSYFVCKNDTARHTPHHPVYDLPS